MFECEFCNHSFSTIFNLENHKKTAKYCKNLQGTNEESIVTCQYCQKKLTNDKTLQRHLKICKVKEYEDKLAVQKDFYENELQKEKQKYNELLTKQNELNNELELIRVEKDDIVNKNIQLQDDKKELFHQIKILENTINLKEEHHTSMNNVLKEFIPKNKISKPQSSVQEEDNDSQSQVTNINGQNVYVTQNQIYIDKVNSLTPINDLLARINQDTTLYNKITSSVEDLTNFIDTEISKCVLFKNIKKLMVCYRYRNENDQIVSLVDNLETVVSLIYFDQTFASRIEEIYKVYDREVPIGDDTTLLELNNSINIFSHFLKADEKNQKIKEGLFKKAFETITKKANTLRH